MLGLSGCEFLDRLSHEVDALEVVLKGGSSPLQKPVGTSAGSGAGARNSPLSIAEQARGNAELLHEVFQVVFQREPASRAQFGSFADSLNQGASIEGIYNGFVHSSDYRKLEVSNPGSTPAALQAFARLLAAFETELPQVTHFGASAASPLAVPVQPSAAAAPGEIDFPASPGPNPSAAAVARPALAALTARYGKEFFGASIYTLKRVVGDEALKVLGAKAASPEGRADWYARFVGETAAYHVDFGLPLRNGADLQFHRNWARSAPADRLTWEVLNRVHRILNHFETHPGTSHQTGTAPQ